jgi:hypothetical protein
MALRQLLLAATDAVIRRYNTPPPPAEITATICKRNVYGKRIGRKVLLEGIKLESTAEFIWESVS